MIFIAVLSANFVRICKPLNSLFSNDFKFLNVVFCTQPHSTPTTAVYRTRTGHDHHCAGQHGPRWWPTALNVPGTAHTKVPPQAAGRTVHPGRTMLCACTICDKEGWPALRPLAGPGPSCLAPRGLHSMPTQDRPAGNSPDVRRVSSALQILRCNDSGPGPPRLRLSLSSCGRALSRAIN